MSRPSLSVLQEAVTPCPPPRLEAEKMLRWVGRGSLPNIAEGMGVCLAAQRPLQGSDWGSYPVSPPDQ